MMKREKERMNSLCDCLWISWTSEVDVKLVERIFHYQSLSLLIFLFVRFWLKNFPIVMASELLDRVRFKSNFSCAQRVICMHDDSTSEIYHFPLSLFLREWRQTNFSDEKNIQKRIFVRISQWWAVCISRVRMDIKLRWVSKNIWWL